MTTSWIATVILCIGVFAYGIYIGRKDERRRRHPPASASGMAFDSKPKGMS